MNTLTVLPRWPVRLRLSLLAALFTAAPVWSQALPVPVGLWPPVQGGTFAASVAVRGDYAYLANSSHGIVVVEIAGRRPPRIVGAVPVAGGGINGIQCAGEHAFVTAASGFYIFSLTDPVRPGLVGSVAMDQPRGPVVSGGVACFSRGLEIHLVDVSDPSAPVLKGAVNLATGPKGYALAGSRLYVSRGTAGNPSNPPRLNILDVSDPASPQLIGGAEGLALGALAARGSLVYGLVGGGLAVLDAGNPENVAILETVSLTGNGTLHLEGDQLVVAGLPGFHLFDLSAPASPTLVSTLTNVGGSAVGLHGKKACLVDQERLATVDLTEPAVPTFAGELLFQPRLMAVDAEGDTACAFEFKRGVYVFDVSEPARPVHVGLFPIRSVSGLAHDIKLRNRRAYAVSANFGLEILDLTEREHPARLGGLDQRAIRIELVDSLAFLAADTQGLRIVDVSNPESPKLVGVGPATGRAIDVAVGGNYAFVAEAQQGVSVWDIRNPAAPNRLAGIRGNASCVALSGDALFVTGPVGVHLAFDVREPAQPRLLWEWGTPGTPQALQVGPRRLFSGMSGPSKIQLAVLDISGRDKPAPLGSIESPGTTSMIQRFAREGRYLYTVTGAGLNAYELPLEIAVVSGPDRGLALEFTAQANRVHVLEYTPQLPPTTWTEAGRARPAGDTGRFELVPKATGAGFFRIREE